MGSQVIFPSPTSVAGFGNRSMLGVDENAAHPALGPLVGWRRCPSPTNNRKFGWIRIARLRDSGLAERVPKVLKLGGT